jgi:zinc protease
MKIQTLLAFVLLFAASSAEAKTEKLRETKLPNGLIAHEYRMSNGMQLLLLPDHSAPVFTFQVWFKVGSAAEKQDPKLNRTGLAHLFEHMMFRGTPKNPDQVFDAKISAAGAVGNNATTWLDRTNYFESLPKERLELIFDLESDRMVNLVLDEKLFKTELGAVFGELKMNEDKPMRVAYRHLWDLAFDKHPYKYTTMGTPEELNSFTVSDAQYFYKTYYAPNNATLILVGDFKIANALRLAEKYYGKIPSQTLPNRWAPEEHKQESARKREVGHPLATADVVLLGYKAPNINHADTAALEVLAAVLAYGSGSILEQELVEKGIASTAFATAYKLRYPGLFVIGAQLAAGKTSGNALDVIRDAVKRVKSGDIKEEELMRAKNQFLLYSYGELMDQSALGEALGEALVSADDYLRGFEILEQVKKVTLADLKRVAEGYLQESSSSLIRLYPAKGK